jgi:hypothetical protein
LGTLVSMGMEHVLKAVRPFARVDDATWAQVEKHVAEHGLTGAAGNIVRAAVEKAGGRSEAGRKAAQARWGNRSGGGDSGGESKGGGGSLKGGAVATINHTMMMDRRLSSSDAVASGDRVLVNVYSDGAGVGVRPGEVMSTTPGKNGGKGTIEVSFGDGVKSFSPDEVMKAPKTVTDAYTGKRVKTGG